MYIADTKSVISCDSIVAYSSWDDFFRKSSSIICSKPIVSKNISAIDCISQFGVLLFFLCKTQFFFRRA